MIDEKLDFKFLKVKNGKPFFAIINLEITKNESENEIIDEYTGVGWETQGNIESVPMKGYDTWKKQLEEDQNLFFYTAARNGKLQ